MCVTCLLKGIVPLDPDQMLQLAGIVLLCMGMVLFLVLMLASSRLSRSQFASLIITSLTAISLLGGVALIVSGAS